MNDDTKLLLVGAGQLGSRYLQGLAHVDTPLSITVVDPSLESLGVAKSRYRQMVDSIESTVAHKISFEQNLLQIPSCIDICCVVTPANCRTNIVSQISTNSSVKFWILEKILAQNPDDLVIIQSTLMNSPAHAWVNTPMRTMSWHKAIKDKLADQGMLAKPLTVKVSGADWGLACNAIHYIDLVAWWTSSTIQKVSISPDSYWIDSKRLGFKELIGKISVEFSDSTLLTLISLPSLTKNLQLSVHNSEGSFLIDESTGIAQSQLGETISGGLDFQSLLTAPLIKSILNTGNCDLPSLDFSVSLHAPLVSNLLSYWNKVNNRHDKIVPVT